jgi:spore coat protein CotH
MTLINENKSEDDATLFDVTAKGNFGSSTSDQAVKGAGSLERKTNELPEDSTKLLDNLRNISEDTSNRQGRRSNTGIF